MQYLLAIILSLLTTLGALLLFGSMVALNTDYRVIPQFADHLIQTHGAEAYLTQLMSEHRSYLRSIVQGAVILFLSAGLWRWWYRRYFAAATTP